jgi:hypothetical protein
MICCRVQPLIAIDRFNRAGTYGKPQQRHVIADMSPRGKQNVAIAIEPEGTAKEGRSTVTRI